MLPGNLFEIAKRKYWFFFRLRDVFDVKRPHIQILTLQVSSIRELCKLHDSKELTNILKEIDHYLEHPRKPSEMIGNVESDPEYQLIVEANSTAVEIDNEICKRKTLIVFDN